MAKENTTICLLGHAGHGKTTLTSAISKLYSNDYRDYLDMNKAGWAYVEFNTNSRYYKLIDSKADNAERTYMSLDKIDGAILLVAATDGPMPQTREHIILASKIGIKKIMVFISKCDLVDEPELLELIEMETRELLSYYDYDGDNCPVIYGSALRALYGEIEWEETIGHLIESLDEYIPYNSSNTSNKTHSNTNNNAYTESNNQKSERNKTMEEIIRNVIEKYSLKGYVNSNPKEKVYTNMDGKLRDGRGNSLSKAQEGKIRSWHWEHFNDGNHTLLIIFHTEEPVNYNTGESGALQFSTCVTNKGISFRAIVEKEGREEERGEYTFFSWNELIKVTEEETIYKNDSHNIPNDPLFWLNEESYGYSFYTQQNVYKNIPVIYFANWIELGEMFNDIINKDITPKANNSQAKDVNTWGSKKSPIPNKRYMGINKQRETLIRKLIEYHDLNTIAFEREENKIYTNLDGTLKDGEGNMMSSQDISKIRSWHYLNHDEPLYVVFSTYVQAKDKSFTTYFSTCITDEFISFRAIDEINGQQNTDYSPFYRLSWDEIKSVDLLNEVEKNNPNLLENDPTFTIWKEGIDTNVFYLKNGGEAVITPPYFAFWGEIEVWLFIQEILDPQSVERREKISAYYDKIAVWQANKEYQKILEANDNIYNEKIGFPVDDYYAIKIIALSGLKEKDKAHKEFEYFKEYIESIEEERLKYYLKSFLKARAAIHSLDEQYYLAAQDNEIIVAKEKEDSRYQVAEKYRDKQKENYQNFLTHFTEIPVKDRNIITIAKTDRLFKSDHLTLLNYDNLPQVHFPMSHPKINHSYIVHPYKTDSYLPIENYDYELLNDRLNEFFYFLQCLGATSISYEVVEDESSQQASRSQQSHGQNNRNSNYNERSNNNQYGGSAGVNLGFVNAEVGGSSSHANSGSNYGEGGYQQDQSQEAVMNSSLRNFLRMGRNQTFDPLQKPYVPNDLIWYPNEYTWQRIAQQRLNGNMLSHSETLSSSQSETLSVSEIASINEELDNLFEEVSSNNAHFDISGKLGIGKFGFKASYNEDKSSTSGHSEASSRKSSSSYRSESKIKKNRDYAVRIHVTFKPMNAFAQDIPYTEAVPAPEPKAAPHTASQSTLSDEEGRYLEEVHFMLQDDGMIDDKERDILERYRTRFGISQARAKEIEDQAMAGSTLTPEEQEYVNEYKAALCDGVLGERDRPILSRLAGFLKLSDKRVAELEEKFKL